MILLPIQSQMQKEIKELFIFFNVFHLRIIAEP